MTDMEMKILMLISSIIINTILKIFLLKIFLISFSPILLTLVTIKMVNSNKEGDIGIILFTIFIFR